MLSGWKEFGLWTTMLLAMLLTAKLFAKTEPTAEGKALAVEHKMSRRVPD
jgi:hypothetical protein